MLAVTALFQGSIYLLDRCSRGTRLPRLTRPRYARESGATPPVQPATAPAAPPPEGSIAELELRLANMRDEARALNSPDTFVQYARVMRNANDLERKLLERRGTYSRICQYVPCGTECRRLVPDIWLTLGLFVLRSA